MKKFVPLSLSIVILVAVCLLWDNLKLAYNSENVIVGEYYYKKFNPLNETVRFLSFILLPFITYFVSYFFINKKTYNLNLGSKNYFLYKKEGNNSNDSLNFYFFLFIILITLEFLALNFSIYVSDVDMFHEGGFLVPPLNYLKNEELFKSTIYDYGFIANNFGLIFKYFFSYYTIGSIIFIKLLLIYLGKFSLILILKSIIIGLNLKYILKISFFILLTFFAVSLANYYDFNSYFSYRHSLYLFFIFILGSALCGGKNLNLRFFVIGIFSLISMLWWFDIGAYVNALIILSIIYLLIHREFKNALFIIFGIVLSWVFFFLIMPIEEIKEFIFQAKLVYSSVYEYLLGIEYRKPFSANSGRWTKALLLIYASSLMLVNLNFSKKFYISFKTKIFINLLFISSVFIFKSALMRSDSHHLKYTSGLYTLLFVLVLMLFLFQRLEASRKIKDLIKNINLQIFHRSIFLFYTIFAILFFSGMFTKHTNTDVIKNIKNVLNFNSNITYLLKSEDDLYLNKDTKLILQYYSRISQSDTCTQTLTSDVAFPYFLRKPTCTQFYTSSQILNGYTETKFIQQLKLASPNIILYKSPVNILTKYSNMPNTIDYINKEYSFYKNYKNYIFYKKN